MNVITDPEEIMSDRILDTRGVKENEGNKKICITYGWAPKGLTYNHASIILYDDITFDNSANAETVKATVNGVKYELTSNTMDFKNTFQISAFNYKGTKSKEDMKKTVKCCQDELTEAKIKIAMGLFAEDYSGTANCMTFVLEVMKANNLLNSECLVKDYISGVLDTVKRSYPRKMSQTSAAILAIYYPSSLIEFKSKMRRFKLA